MQNGSIMRSERRRGPEVWEYRWREPGAEGKRKHRRIVVGSVDRIADKAAAFRATSALRRDINLANMRCNAKPVPLSQLAERLHLKPGDRFKFFFHPDGVIILPKITTSRLKGIIPKRARPVSLGEIDAAVEAGATDRFRQKNRRESA